MGNETFYWDGLSSFWVKFPSDREKRTVIGPNGWQGTENVRVVTSAGPICGTSGDGDTHITVTPAHRNDKIT